MEQRAQQQAAFLDWVASLLGVKNDSALGRALGTSRFTMSKYRHGKLPISHRMILAVHEETGMPTKAIKAKLA